MQNDTQRGEQYARMSELDDFHVSEEDPDPRGWAVIGRDGGAIGRVQDLIVDTSAMKVQYLEIAVADADTSGGSLARIPAGRVDLEPDQRLVVTDLSRSELSAFMIGTSETQYAATDMPADVTDDVTDDMTERFDTTTARAASTADDDVTRLTRSEEELRIGKREVQAGEVVVGKHVETERVSMPVQRRVEHVRIERRPVTGATGSAELREGEIRVPIMEEEVVVEKRPVVKEEIVLTRETATETENVEADVRREHVDISGDERLVDQTDETRTRARGGNRG